LGVGYKIARGLENSKKVICLNRKKDGKKLSTIISGCKEVTNI